jgi:kynurenine formamidase
MAAYQNVQFAVGDVLIIRTGFLDWYGDASEDQRATAFSQLSFTGVAQGDDTQRWLWNKRFAAVAGDSVSWERKLLSSLLCHPRTPLFQSLIDSLGFPPPKDGSMLHQWLLPHAGLPIGELWNLEELSDACAKLKKWEFLFCSAPLNIKGGIASPPNAVALL